MKTIFLVTFLFNCPTVFSNEVIQLEPGTSITIENQTIFCKEDPSQLVHFCNCLDAGPQYMVNLEFVLFNSYGEKTTHLLGRFNDLAACNAALETKGSCKN